MKEPPTPQNSSTLSVAQDSEIIRLQTERPAGWEYLLFAAFLARAQKRLRGRQRDHELRLPSAPYHRVEEDAVVDYLSAAFGEVAWIVGPLNRVFEAHTDAFGAPGESGDPFLIEHFAAWIGKTFERLVDWAGRLRSAGPPEGFETAFELAARAADRPAVQIWEAMGQLIEEAAQLPGQLANRAEGAEPIVIDATLHIQLEEGVLDEALDALRAALEQT